MIDCAFQKKLHTAEGEMLLNVELRLESGKFVGLYGRSGAGKTSVLRMLAGFMQPDEGYIKAGDNWWFDATRKINVEPRLRNIGFVFQDYALFPNMNVRENIAFAVNKKDNANIVDELLDLTGLTALANRKIDTLSGGQKQRVALARAIAKKPLLLLLDEPLSAIDDTMRQQLQGMLLEAHSRYALTTVLVSHDMGEIMRLCDSVVHLENGSAYHHVSPSSFFNTKNENGFLDGKIVSIENDGQQATATVLLDTHLLKIKLPDNFEGVQKGLEVKIVAKDGTLHIAPLPL
jgi:molybdate transport system ATP-binding protein